MVPPAHPRAARLAGAALAAALVVGALVVPALAAPSTPAGTSASTGSSVTGSGPVVATDPVRSRRRYALVADAPASVVAGSTFEVLGSAANATRRARLARPVVLSERRDGSWTQLQRVRTTTYGGFAFTLAAGDTVATRVLRVDAPAYRGLRPARTGPLTVDVVDDPATPTDPTDPTDPTEPPVEPPPVPAGPTEPAGPTSPFDAPEPLPAGYVGAGSSSDWSYLFTGGARWNPCRVIRWAYNPAGEGYPALADVQRAMARIAGVSELRFSYVGATTWRYLGNVAEPTFPADRADIVVGWANETELPRLAGNVVGVGGGWGYGVTGSDVRVRIERGFLTLDNGHVLPGGFDQSGWGQITLHEILHALGLGHARESVQIMYGTAHRGNTRFGAGDLTGMQVVGASSGCLP